MGIRCAENRHPAWYVLMEINGHEYRVGKLSAMAQFHVSRRIAPILPTLIPIFLKMSRKDPKEAGIFEDLDGLSSVLQPFADGIAAMSDQDSEHVFTSCLSVVSRQAGNSFTPIWNQQHQACLFDDIDLSVMIKLVVEVIKDSLQPFIKGLLTSQTSNPNQK